jgi:hypothetical protein
MRKPQCAVSISLSYHLSQIVFTTFCTTFCITSCTTSCTTISLPNLPAVAVFIQGQFITHFYKCIAGLNLAQIVAINT